MSDWPEVKTYYQGRKWDAPMTDDAIEMDIGALGLDCAMCQEPITAEDNAIMTLQAWHLECHLRVLGDVQHLEGRCMCSRGSGNEIVYETDKYETYRDSARATLKWLVDHNQGRFHDE